MVVRHILLLVLKPVRTQKGFTLIELLVVVSIMALLTGGGLVAYLRFEERQATEVITRNLREMFITARTKARFREQGGCLSDQGVIGFRVRTRPAGDDIETSIGSICGNDRAGYAETDVNYAPTSASTLLFRDGQYVLTTSPSVSTPFLIDYYTLYGGARINATGESDMDKLQLKIRRGAAEYGFSIDKGGDISPIVRLL